MLIVIMFNVTGVFTVFKIEHIKIRQAIKRQIKAGIPEDDLHFFSLSQDAYENLEWIREGFEFRAGSHMFDIVRVEKKGNAIHLYCVNDEEEASLFALLDEMVKKKQEHDSNSPNSSANTFVKFLKLFHFVEDINHPAQPNFATAKNTFTETTICYSSPFLDREITPPDTV